MPAGPARRRAAILREIGDAAGILSSTTPYNVLAYAAGGTSPGVRQNTVTVTVAPGSAMLLALHP